MQLSSPTKILAGAVEAAASPAKSNPKLGILSEVLIHASQKEQKLRISGTDGALSVAVVISHPDLHIERGGKGCLPAADLLAYLKRAPSTLISLSIMLTGESGKSGASQANLQSGRSRFALQGGDANDFPAFAPPAPDSPRIAVEAGALLSSLQILLPCIDNIRSGDFYGICFRAREGGLELCSFDRVRAALALSLPVIEGDAIEGDATLSPFVVPRTAIDALILCLASCPGEAPVVITGSPAGNVASQAGATAAFKIDALGMTTTIRTALLSKEWPDLSRVFQGESSHTLRVNRRDLDGAIRRCQIAMGSLDNGGGDPYLELSFAQDSVRLCARDTGGKSAEEELACQVQAAPEAEAQGRIALNSNYLAQALKVLAEDEVLLDYDGPTKFFKVRHPIEAMFHGISPMGLRKL